MNESKFYKGMLWIVMVILFWSFALIYEVVNRINTLEVEVAILRAHTEANSDALLFQDMQLEDLEMASIAPQEYEATH